MKELKLITFSAAAEICQRFKPDDRALMLLKPSSTPSQFYPALTQNLLGRDALLFLAHGLPERAAIHWSCLCLEKAIPGLSPWEQELTRACRGWVLSPTIERQKAVRVMLGKKTPQTSVTWTAQAIVWSSTGSSSSKPPASGLVGQAVSGAIGLAAVASSPDFAGLLARIHAGWAGVFAGVNAALAGLPKFPGAPAFPTLECGAPALSSPSAPGLPAAEAPSFPAFRGNLPLAAIPAAAAEFFKLTMPELQIPPKPPLAMGQLEIPDPKLALSLPQVALGTIPAPSVQQPQVNIPAAPGLPSVPALPGIGAVPSVKLPQSPKLAPPDPAAQKLAALYAPLLAIGEQIAALELAIPEPAKAA